MAALRQASIAGGFMTLRSLAGPLVFSSELDDGVRSHFEVDISHFSLFDDPMFAR